MIVRTFMPRMSPLVESGQKHQTVRKRPKRMPKAGELFSGRAWTGKPYCSTQRLLVLSPITRVLDIDIPFHSPTGSLIAIRLSGMWLNNHEIEQFARLDGFKDAADMRQEFERMKELPLENGIVIYWK